MPHFDEMTCMQYLDGQLDRSRAAELTAHADSCGECRRLLRVLEREAQLLQGALVEEDEAVPARVLSPPFAEKASWAWITSFGLASAGAYFFWAEMVSPWLSNMGQAGFGEGNLLTLLFFGGVFWKGWGDMLSLVQTLATGTLVILGIGLLMRLGRRLSTVTMVLATLLATLLLPSGASAAEIRKNKASLVVAAGETVANDLIVAGGTVRIDGTVQGDLIVFCHSLTVNGHVTGDVIAFAQSARIDGTVDGDVRTFSNTLVLSGTVARNLMLFAQSLDLSSKGQVGGGVIAFAESLTLDGKIGRDVLSFGERTILNARVAGDIQAQGKQLLIGSTAEVLGKTRFKGSANPEVEAGAKLASPVEFEKMTRRPDYASPRFYWRQALRWGSAFVLGLALVLLFPGFFRDTMRAAERPGATTVAGVAAFFGLLVGACIACITLVGMGVGLIALAFWAALLYAAQVFFGAWLGTKLMGPAAGTGALLGRLAVGLLVIRVAGNLPFTIGFWVWLVVLVMGMGIFTLTAHNRMRREPAAPAPAPVAAV